MTYDPRPGSDSVLARLDVEEFAPEESVLTNGQSVSNPDDVEAAADGFRLTDVGNAKRLVKLARGRIRYVDPWKSWVVYEGGRWVLDKNDVRVTKMAKKVGRHLFGLMADAADRKKALQAAERAESDAGTRAMVNVARSEDGVLVDFQDFDADADILNVRNGTIDLRTSELRPHEPADLCMKQSPVRYDPDARSELWEACLERWHPDPGVRAYLQLEMGQALIGRNSRVLPIHLGSGKNGKTVFWGAGQHVLGDYAVTPHIGLLVRQRHDQHTTELVHLFRARLVVASETAKDDVLANEQVKKLTSGGDTFEARRLYENPWEFSPTWLLVMFTNDRPKVKGRDPALWDRLRVIPWDVRIADDEQDDRLAEKLRAEAPGILAWMVEGARRAYVERFNDPAVVPEVVRAATERYRTDEKTAVERFVDDRLTLGAGWAKAKEIEEEAAEWAREQGVPPPTRNEIAEILKAENCHSERRSVDGERLMIWSGVSLDPVLGIEGDTA